MCKLRYFLFSFHPLHALQRDLPLGVDQRSPARHPDFLGPDDMIIKIDKVLGKDGKKPTETKTMKIGKARPLLEEMEMDKLLNADNITKEAIKIAKQ